MTDTPTNADSNPPASGTTFRTETSRTHHTAELNGEEFRYRATAEWTTLRKIHKPIAEVFHTSYLAEGDDNISRPLTFVFNGGPGAASAFLHMGALGPQRVAFGESGSVPPMPVEVVDNLETWLAFTDLVFIDPIGTGFSRAIKEEPAGATPVSAKDQADGPKEDTDFWEIDRDLDSLGELICRILSQLHRWTSPLFIAGESYGGFRVAKMAKSLQETHGVGLCGALLISPAIEFEGLFGTDYNLTHWVEVFPSLVATAHHHKLTRNVADDISQEELLAVAASFATNDLSRWLALGNALPESERSSIVVRMAGLTGLSEAFIERASGRITPSEFCRELLRNQRRVLGMYDASISTVDPFPDRTNFEGPDPSLMSIDRLFTAAINHQLRSTLKVDSELDYRLICMEVFQKWKHEAAEEVFNSAVGAMDDLRYGMSLNEHMKVFIAHGCFDLVTPCYATGRQLGLMKLTKAQEQNLSTKNYDGGHMFYSWDTSRVAFRNDAAEFYKLAIPDRT
ncbi:MAG: S10 family peptidase [Planctomycetales bacterium]|jgi:carboxypeptidase C (cathepsin A)